MEASAEIGAKTAAAAIANTHCLKRVIPQIPALRFMQQRRTWLGLGAPKKPRFGPPELEQVW
jgi:hypothetical protein